MAFEPGEFVVVKSGGPKMTVTGLTGDDVRCVWMEADGRSWIKREDTFPDISLTVFTPPLSRNVRLGILGHRGY